MKTSKIIIILSAIVSSLPVFSLDLIPDQNSKGKWGYVDELGKKIINYDYTEAGPFIDGRAKVKKGDQYGYIGPDGKPVIKIQYTEMMTWNEGRCKVAVGGNVKDGVLSGAKYGYINMRGEYLLKPEYDEIGTLNDGLMYVKKGQKYGYLSKDFGIIVPCKFTSIGSFNEYDVCWVCDGGKYGLYSRSGSELIAPKFKKLGTFEAIPTENNPFMAKIIASQEGQEMIKKRGKEVAKGMSGKAMLAGLTGNTADVIEETQKRSNEAYMNFFEDVSNMVSSIDLDVMQECGGYGLIGYKFIDGKLFSKLDMSQSQYIAVSNVNIPAAQNFGVNSLMTMLYDKIGIYSKNGVEILKPGLYPLAFPPTEGLIPVVKGKGKKGYEINYVYESTGKLLMKKWLPSTGIAPFENGVAIVPNGDVHYILSSTGEKKSREYSMILPLRASVFVVKSGEKWGMIDINGNELISPTWHKIMPGCDGLFCASENSYKYGYVDNTGKFAIPAEYSEAKSFMGGSSCVKSEKGWGVIDITNRHIVDCQWQDAKSVSPNYPSLCWVKNSAGWLCLNTQSNSPAFENIYADVRNFNEEGYAIVFNELGKVGVIDQEGNTIIPLNLTNENMASSCITYMKDNNIESLKPVDAYRYNLNNDEKRHKLRLSHVIENELWDY